MCSSSLNSPSTPLVTHLQICQLENQQAHCVSVDRSREGTDHRGDQMGTLRRPGEHPKGEAAITNARSSVKMGLRQNSEETGVSAFE